MEEICIDNKTFIKVPNKFFIIEKNEYGEDTIGTFERIGTEGFTIWCYLLMTQGNQVAAQTSIKRIVTFLNRNKDTRSKKAKNGLTDYRTIKKYLNILLNTEIEIKLGEQDKEKKTVKVKMIECGENFNNFNDVRADDELFIITNSCVAGKEAFSAISTQLFYDYVHRIGHIGWSIYCMLFQYHNITFGNQQAGNCGFASCSEEYIAKILKRNKATISEYIRNFGGLIKIHEQEPITLINPKSGKEEFKYMPNHYIVWAKVDVGNKYHIDNTKKVSS